MTARVAAALSTLVLLLAACGGAPVEPAEPVEPADGAAAPSAAAGSMLRVPERDAAPDPDAADDPAASGEAEGSAAPDPGPSPGPPPGPSPAPSPGPPPGPTPEPSAAPDVATMQPAAPRGATRADTAAYLRRVQPDGVRDLDGVAVDLDADGTHEVVLSGVREGHGWLALAAWDGRGYRIVAEGRGGPGERVEKVSVADVNGDEVREAVLEVSGDGAGSLALWRVPPRIALVPLRADGGCHDGSHVYGAVGAQLVPGPTEGVLDVAATCDDTPLPRADWSTQRWSWDGEAYVHVPEGRGRGVGPPPNTPPSTPPGPPSDTPRGGAAAEGD